MIQTAANTYNFSTLDTWLASAQSSGAEVLFTMAGTPNFISSNPTQACSGFNAAGACAPPSDVSSGDVTWKGFVTALVQHSLASSTAHIKVYEMWNEPDISWTGTTAQLVQMAGDAYTIIHSLDPNALVAGPPPSAAPGNYLTPYYAAGGTPYQDIVAFHVYPNTTNASTVANILTSLRSATSPINSVAGLPVWGTEGSWGQNTTMTNDQQVAYLAQLYLLLWNANVARFYWYSWDNPVWGTLWDSTNGIHPAGTALGLLNGWLTGTQHTLNPCSEDANQTWTCALTNDGVAEDIYWNASQSIAVSTPGFTHYQTLDNSTVNPISGGSVTVSLKPILVTP